MKFTDATQFILNLSSKKELAHNTEFKDFLRGYSIVEKGGEPQETYHVPPKATAQQVIDFLTAAINCPYIQPDELSEYIGAANHCSITSKLTFAKAAPLMARFASKCKSENDWIKDRYRSDADRAEHKKNLKYLHYSFLKFMDFFLPENEASDEKEVQKFCLEHDLTHAFGTLPNLPSNKEDKSDTQKYHSKLLRHAVNFFRRKGVFYIGEYSKIFELKRYQYEAPKKRRAYAYGDDDYEDDDFEKEKEKEPAAEYATKKPFSEHYSPRRIAQILGEIKSTLSHYETTVGNAAEKLDELRNPLKIDFEFSENFKKAEQSDPDPREFYLSQDTIAFDLNLACNFSKVTSEDLDANKKQVAKALDFLETIGVKVSFHDKELQDCAAQLQKKYRGVEKPTAKKMLPHSQDHTTA